jgi:hypothetical protein
MSIRVFSDKDHPPTLAEIYMVIGTKKPLWENLVRFIEESYRIKGILSYGGKNYGWELGFRKGSKPLMSAFPKKDGFIVQIVLGKKQVEEAHKLNLGKNVGTTFENARQFHDRRWLYVKVETEQDINDITKLLVAKVKPKI